LFQVFSRVIFLSTLALATGCGSKGAVSLSAHLEEPALTVVSLPLGTSLSGEFDLVLELGSAAAEPTQVSLGSFSIKSDAGILVDSLTVTADQRFPVAVSAGDSQRVHFSLDDSKLVETSTAASICSAEIWLAGTVTDSLSGGKPTPVSSPTFLPTCPD
jgi:hypothetical protein